MEPHSPALERAPEARAETVDDLVAAALRGRLRLPTFQRGLKWQRKNVVELFDSLYRGLPIGSLLIWKRAAPAERVRIGPLTVDAEEVGDGWWVVDGQQRLTSLAAGLARSWPPPADTSDPYVVFFDPSGRRFQAPADWSKAPSVWVPLPRFLNASDLGEWMMSWAHRDDAELRKRVFEAGKRLREYRVPMYLVETDDENVLREIFFRVNKSGSPLAWEDVHDALFGHQGDEPSTIHGLGAAVAEMGIGRILEPQLLACLLAFRGLDVTRTLSEHVDRDRAVLEGAANEALPALRRALVFLRGHASIPHLRLLPRAWVLETLTRFFALHDEPSPRSLELLTRWTWRTLVNASDGNVRRSAIALIDSDEEGSVQRLLALVSRDRIHLVVPTMFDARSPETRLSLLAMAELEPRHVQDGSRLDIATLLENEKISALSEPFGGSGAVVGPVGRVLHTNIPGLGSSFRERAKGHAADRDLVLESHGIDSVAAAALAAGDVARFLELRAAALEMVLNDLADRRCGWSREDRDRPSMRYLLDLSEASL